MTKCHWKNFKWFGNPREWRRFFWRWFEVICGWRTQATSLW